MSQLTLTHNTTEHRQIKKSVRTLDLNEITLHIPPTVQNVPNFCSDATRNPSGRVVTRVCWVSSERFAKTTRGASSIGFERGTFVVSVDVEHKQRFEIEFWLIIQRRRNDSLNANTSDIQISSISQQPSTDHSVYRCI